jgi:hypothetical protein
MVVPPKLDDADAGEGEERQGEQKDGHPKISRRYNG